MTLEEKVGHHFAIGLPGGALTPDLLDHVRRLHARHLVVFSRNFLSATQFRGWVDALRRAVSWPLTVMVDHEGGRVIRFSEGVTVFPAAATMAQRGLAAIEAQGRTEARELRDLGVDVNLAPCLDVRVENADPVIGDRSYGSQPEEVGAFGVARIRGLQHHGVGACAKHFPGLGSVPRDPHKFLPTVILGWEEMEEVHLAPFESAVAAGVERVMSSHVCYPGLGEPKGLPATFSPRLIRGILRERLGFKGLILTDDMDMGALRGCATVGEGAVRALDAGHDLLLLCADLEAQREAFSTVCSAYKNGSLNAQLLESTVDRVRALQK